MFLTPGLNRRQFLVEGPESCKLSLEHLGRDSPFLQAAHVQGGVLLSPSDSDAPSAQLHALCVCSRWFRLTGVI